MTDQMKAIENLIEIKKQTENLQAIVFDLDDTLYPLDDYVRSGFHQISRLFLGRTQEVYEQLWKAYEEHRAAGEDTVAADQPETDNADIHAVVAGAVREMLQAQELYSEEMAEKCLRIYEQHHPDIKPYDGIVELLQELRDRGMRLGLLTDGPAEMQREKLRALGIVPLFDEIIITDDIAGHGDVMKFRTPNPICFEIMRLRLGVEFRQMGYVHLPQRGRE